VTLAEFVERAPAGIAAFSDAYSRMATVDPSFYPERTEMDWWREVAAYFAYVVVEEAVRRQEGGAR
jgi:hypothetical protein